MPFRYFPPNENIDNFTSGHVSNLARRSRSHIHVFVSSSTRSSTTLIQSDPCRDFDKTEAPGNQFVVRVSQRLVRFPIL